MGEAATKTSGLVSLFDVLPDAAQAELVRRLGLIGEDMEPIMKAQTPERTGLLRGDIAIQVQRLRVRIGLFNLRKGKNRPWYAFIVHYGRRASTVMVHRLSRSDRREWGRRKRALAPGAPKLTKKPADLGAAYPLRVRATVPRPFTVIPPAVEARVIANRVADFWSKTLSSAGAGQ